MLKLHEPPSGTPQFLRLIQRVGALRASLKEFPTKQFQEVSTGHGLREGGDTTLVGDSVKGEIKVCNPELGCLRRRPLP